MAPITINRGPWNALVDDPGNNLEGTPWTKDQIKVVILDPIDVALADVDDGTTKDAAQDTLINANTAAIANRIGPTIVTDNSAGALNNFVLPGRTHDTIWQWAGAADLALTGLAGGVAGDRLTIKNVAASPRKITFAQLSGSSATINTFYNAVTSAPTPIGAGGWITYYHNGSNWVLLDHEQGTPISAPFNAANFLASGGAWAVTAGNLTNLSYVIRGKAILIFVTVEGTTIAVAGQYLTILNGAYGGFTGAATTTLFPCTCNSGAGSTEPGFAQCAAYYGLDRLVMFRPGTANWPAGAGAGVYYCAQFPIT
jgi:hypothetical protein